MRVWVYRRRFWWSALNPDEALATIDTPTYFRARTRERAIEKCVRAFAPRTPGHEEVVVEFPATARLGEQEQENG